MPPKAKTPAPIDRPLSKAYLRGFTGWSTAYPPGHSEPTSLQIMENMVVDRNGALAVRPGLRYLSYLTSPNMSTTLPSEPGTAIDRPMVGTQEPFYVTSGARALLCAVREADGTVGFRALLFTGTHTVVHRLTDPEIDFEIPQGEAAINFSAATTHVEYLQIDNKIIAMAHSDAPMGEGVRIFYVGAEKIVKCPGALSVPRWEDSHKLGVIHPDDTWINKQGYTIRRNEVYNPSFEASGFWAIEGPGSIVVKGGGGAAGTHRMVVQSVPGRTNMAVSPLHSVATTGAAGWHPATDYGNPKVTTDDTYLKITDSKGSGTFLAYSSKTSHNVTAGKKYKVAADVVIGTNVVPVIWVSFYNASGALIGNRVKLNFSKASKRHVSAAFAAPAGSVAVRISMGGTNEKSSSTFVKFRNLILCPDGESTDMFHGNSGVNYYWTGVANQSASVYHPPANVSLRCHRIPIRSGTPWAASIHTWAPVAKTVNISARSFDSSDVLLHTYTGTITTTGAGQKVTAGTATSPVAAVRADMLVTVVGLGRDEYVNLDAAMIEQGAATTGAYFDGSTPGTATVVNQWADRSKPHQTFSVQTTVSAVPLIPTPETPTAKTLIASGGAVNNPYKIGFFYTFENEVGESAPSKVTEVRTSRPWSNWLWETVNPTSGEPSGTPTPIAELAADQLAVVMPIEVYAQGIAEGAIRWNLYAFAWSDQEAVPVVAQLIESRQLYPDTVVAARATNPPTYAEGGWLSVTPARKIGLNDVVLPTRNNRVNYSTPSRARNGFVAGDRIILLGDPIAGLATIRWTSNRPGEYTNFTAARGGGAKTLTSGNLNIPGAVVLWQNPQSVDTLTVLCMSLDGNSVSYYMMPATVTAQQSTTSIMGFEETTSTPGTVSPYGAEVLNNALFRPTDKALLKSTASNYNISHKTMTDKISNMWWKLRSKEWIMSAKLDNRLFYLVHNPYGELLESGCKGNEVWTYDMASEAGIWSRALVQGCALRVFNVGSREYLGITRPDGLFYFDQDARQDDYVAADRKVLQRPIPWRFETNTQGANRAHDAWAHLQQIQVTLGNFHGTMRYGIRGQDVNHQRIDVSKEVSDLRNPSEDESRWDFDDALQVRRGMKEWFLYAESVEGKPSSGQIGYVQYRYTPISVNIGYEFGSIETFDYGSNVAAGPNGYSDNGIPIPAMDYSRP